MSFLSFYENKSILITGGTGTIGQYLIDEILTHSPRVARILSRDEYKQFEMQQKYHKYNNIRYLIGDVRDEKRLIRAMEDIDFVFHLAAMKHVPACEYNPFEAVQTNVMGTQNIIQAALGAGVKRVLFTSTDKAISPTNTYGATKLTAERLIAASDYQKGSKKTIFSAVRFGNVMGSRGSVIPLFKKQILEQNRVTITDRNMIRYMMTPKQAITLMLKANQLAFGGEVFVLKMPVIRLEDLVEIMIEEITRKYNLSKQIKIEEIGLRPGEKMYEELMTEDEARIALETEDMYIIKSPYRSQQSYSVIAEPNTKKPALTGENIINKETLRDWILQEKLLD